MKIIDQSFEYVNKPNYKETLYVTETAIRNCYQSEPKGNPSSIIRKILDNNHESTLEHVSITIKAVVDRGVSHEWVRHRAGVGYSQSSTRYCNYSKNKFGNEIKVVKPHWIPWDTIEYIEACIFGGGFVPDTVSAMWYDSCAVAEDYYLNMVKEGIKPEDARSVLPHSLATKIVVTMNIRAWRHFFKLRCSKKAHPDMRVIACMIRDDFVNKFPIFFEDLKDG